MSRGEDRTCRLADLAIPARAIDIECCNPDCARSARLWGPEIATLAERWPVTIQAFRMRLRCSRCGARCGVKVMAGERAGRKGRGGWRFTEDRSIWKRP